MRTRSRRCPPKILGNTARAPQALRSLAGPSNTLGAAPPSGRPGVRNFPRQRHAAPLGECHRSIAVAKYLARRNDRLTVAAAKAEPAAGSGRKGKRKGWSGRPVAETPGLAHSPAVARPVTPPREAGAGNPDLTPWAARRNAARSGVRDRVHPARPRPSRVLAELVTDATP
ncbi:hypothetical protein [Nannocystis bainbridge]|uniref:Uncharacterized protein n=1 Tax=Nannocystis bainbridge TaxID=2995303 RepID=A0ABT5EBK6_9BACT|nr:hypothetical protein [Nannocystis bainbridge]MDC0723254.1 hypothetical protein [Nannocystis bainbridge]